MKRFIILISFMYLLDIAYAQTRPLIVKADAFNYAFRGGKDISIEYFITKKTGFELNYNFGTKEFQRNNVAFKYSPIEGKVKENILNAAFRFYMDKSIPAPIGEYFYLQAGAGTIDLEGEHTVSAAELGYLYDFDVTQKFTVSNVPVYRFELGFGGQQAIFRKLILDFSLGYGVAVGSDIPVSAGSDAPMELMGYYLSNYTQWLSRQEILLETYSGGFNAKLGVGYKIF